MKTAQDFAKEAVGRGIISKANENELELHMLHYMEELLKNWNAANKNCVQPDVSGQFEIIADRLLGELGAELSRISKEELVKIISNCR